MFNFSCKTQEMKHCTPCTISHSVGPPGVKLWTLATATFYEKNIVFVSEAGVDVFSLLLFSPLIDTYMYVCM